MLAVADAALAELPGAGPQPRDAWSTARLTRCRFADESFDIVTSAFVLQLVPVAPPGAARGPAGAGRTGARSATSPGWQAGRWRPTRPTMTRWSRPAWSHGTPGPGQDDLPSARRGRRPSSAERDSRRAAARAGMVDHRYTPRGLPVVPRAVRRRGPVRDPRRRPHGRRWRRTSWPGCGASRPDGLRLRLPVVYALGRRPARA